jgi:hypothetical protein
MISTTSKNPSRRIAFFPFLGAFFAAEPQKTGLSAPIFCAEESAQKYFRFNPLRGLNPAFLPD